MSPFIAARFGLGVAVAVAMTVSRGPGAPSALADEVYQTPEAFVAEVFGGATPAPKRLWITKPRKADIARILGHGLGALRVPYWERDGRTAWILEEIGKVRPITTGFVVTGGHLETVKVLIYRESRGWEIRFPFFTDQFMGAALDPTLKLDRSIDGISGATLSVDALTRLSALALYLHAQTVGG